MRAVLEVAAMECRRVAGRFVVPTLAVLAVAAGWGLYLQASWPSVR